MKKYNLRLLLVCLTFTFAITACQSSRGLWGDRSGSPKHRFSENDRQNFLADKHSLSEDNVSCKDCHGNEKPDGAASVAKCIECHGRDDVTSATKNMFPVNPHKSHYGEIKCILCHKGHQPFELYCNVCHFFEVNAR